MDIEEGIFLIVMAAVFLGFGVIIVDIAVTEEDNRENVQCEILHVKTQENKTIEITGCHRIDDNQNRWWITTKDVDRFIVEK